MEDHVSSFIWAVGLTRHWCVWAGGKEQQCRVYCQFLVYEQMRGNNNVVCMGRWESISVLCVMLGYRRLSFEITITRSVCVLSGWIIAPFLYDGFVYTILTAHTELKYKLTM